MSCIARTGQRFGAGHVIDVLTGKQNDKVQRFRHDRLSTFGIGQDLTAVEWRAIIRQLVAADFLRVDVTGYGGIRLAPTCGPVLKGEEAVFFRKEARRPSKKQKKSCRPPRPSHTSSPDDAELFEALRKLRSSLAQEQGVPPYIVFGDTTLRAMVSYRPTTLEAFSHLSGVGQIKLERYGTVFLEAIQRHEEENPTL